MVSIRAQTWWKRLRCSLWNFLCGLEVSLSTFGWPILFSVGICSTCNLSLFVVCVLASLYVGAGLGRFMPPLTRDRMVGNTISTIYEFARSKKETKAQFQHSGSWGLVSPMFFSLFYVRARTCLFAHDRPLMCFRVGEGCLMEGILDRAEKRNRKRVRYGWSSG